MRWWAGRAHSCLCGQLREPEPASLPAAGGPEVDLARRRRAVNMETVRHVAGGAGSASARPWLGGPLGACIAGACPTWRRGLRGHPRPTRTARPWLVQAGPSRTATAASSGAWAWSRPRCVRPRPGPPALRAFLPPAHWHQRVCGEGFHHPRRSVPISGKPVLYISIACNCVTPIKAPKQTRVKGNNDLQPFE